MYKVKVAVMNLIITALLGAFMQIVWVFLSGDKNQLTPYNVINMMCISAIIGTICLFALFYVTLKNMGSLIKAVVINTILVILLCIAVYLETGIFFSNWTLDAKWVVILAIATTASLAMTIIWYKKIRLFNNKLELKKASLNKGKRKES